MSLAQKLARVWGVTPATATDATNATEGTIPQVTVANVAPVAVATGEAAYDASPANAVSAQARAEARRHIARAELTPEAPGASGRLGAYP